jgi:hypothetical protein
MLKTIASRYKEGKALWDNKDGLIKPVFPYWVFLMLMTTSVMVLMGMVFHIATR